MEKAIFGGALFIGGCIAGFASLLLDIERTYRFVLMNFSLVCIIIGIILGISSIVKRKND